MPPPPTPIGAERLSQLTQKESYVFVIALNPSRLFLYPSYFVHCTHCEGVGESCMKSIPVWGECFHSVGFWRAGHHCLWQDSDMCQHLRDSHQRKNTKYMHRIWEGKLEWKSEYISLIWTQGYSPELMLPLSNSPAAFVLLSANRDVCYCVWPQRMQP